MYLEKLQHVQVLVLAILISFSALGAESEIEEQLEEIGRIPNREIISVQKKYTRKEWRHELTPLSIGGIPFGTVRRTLTGGAGYSLHLNDWLAWESTFVYTKNFFTSFTSDINAQALNTPDITPLVQNLVFVLGTGVQFAPWHGKLATFSRWIVYMEPIITLGVGIAKTDTNLYLTAYPGFGLRVFFREWVSLKVEFRDYIYRETSSAGNSTLTNNYSVAVSLSFWLPKMPR